MISRRYKFNVSGIQMINSGSLKSLLSNVMWGRTYSRRRRARDVRRAAESQSNEGAAVTMAGASAGLGLGSG